MRPLCASLAELAAAHGYNRATLRILRRLLAHAAVAA